MNPEQIIAAAVNLVATKVLAARVTAAEKANKAILDAQLAEGTKITGIVHHDGRKITLGSVTKASPKPKAVVTDRAAFRDYLLTKRSDEAIITVTLDPADTGEIAAALHDAGKSHLVQETETVPDWVEAEEIRNAENGKTVPGVEIQQRAPYLSARPAKDADAEVEALFKAGVLDMATLALEPGQ